MNENVWQIKEILRQFPLFVNQLTPSSARLTAYGRGMLEPAQRDKLIKDEELGRNHNEQLLGILESRGFDGFKCLLDILEAHQRHAWANELRVLASLPEEAASPVTPHNDAGPTTLPPQPPGADAVAREQHEHVDDQHSPSGLNEEIEQLKTELAHKEEMLRQRQQNRAEPYSHSNPSEVQPFLTVDLCLDVDDKCRIELSWLRQRSAVPDSGAPRQADGNSARPHVSVSSSSQASVMVSASVCPPSGPYESCHPTNIQHQLRTQLVGFPDLKAGGTGKMPAPSPNPISRPTKVHQGEMQQQQQQNAGQEEAQRASSSDSAVRQSPCDAKLQQTSSTTIDNAPEESARNDRHGNEPIQGMRKYWVMVVNSALGMREHMYQIAKRVFFSAFASSAGRSTELSQDPSRSVRFCLQMSPRSVYRLATIAEFQPGFLAGIGLLDFREEHSNVVFSVRKVPSRTTNTWTAEERLDANAVTYQLLADRIVTEDDVRVANGGSSWNYFVKHITKISLLHSNGPRRVLELLACLSLELSEIVDETEPQTEDVSSQWSTDDIRNCSSHQVNASTTEGRAYATCLSSSTTAAISTMTSSESNSMVYTSVSMSPTPSSQPAGMMPQTGDGIVPQQPSIMSLPPGRMPQPTMMSYPPGMKKKTARMSRPPGMMSQPAMMSRGVSRPVAMPQQHGLMSQPSIIPHPPGIMSLPTMPSQPPGMSQPPMMLQPAVMAQPHGMTSQAAMMSQTPGIMSQSAVMSQPHSMMSQPALMSQSPMMSQPHEITQIFPANTAQQEPCYHGNPPPLTTSGHLAACGSTDRSWPWLSANQTHMRHLLTDNYRQARLDVDEDMLEEGLEATVENLAIEIVFLPHSDLRKEFREPSFDSSGDMWRVEHVFTSAGQRLQNVTLQSLFEDIPEKVLQRGTTFRVVVISSAGCGKTTVFTKVVPFRWASGDLWSNLFDMVFARELRYEEVRRAKSAQDLLNLSRFNLTVEQCQEVLQYVKHHPERVCLVLDGLDETSLSSCSNFVQDVIRGHELQGIRLVLTSRPSGDIFRLTDSERLDRKVELVGFRPEDVRLFVRKFLKASEATKLLKEIDNNPHLLSMMSTPVLAYEICKLYHWRMRVPRCVADIFELMILRLAERRSEFQYSTWNDVPESVRTAILSLGYFSFRKLQDQQLVFTETELQSCSILRDAIFHGLLVACDHNPADVSVKQWRFSHLTLQENLAAKFVACSGTMSSGKIVRLVECLDPDAGHMRTFWMLLAAQLNSACLETLVNSLMLCEKEEGAHLPKMSVADVSKLNFPQTYHGILYECLSRSSMNRLAELLLGAVSSGSAIKLVESKMSPVHSSPDGDFLETLLLTWVNEFPAANESMLVEALKHIDEGAAQLCREVKEQMLESSCAPHSLSFPKHASFYDTKPLGVRRQLAFYCFAEYAMYHDDDVQPVPSIAESLLHKKSKITACGDRNPWLCRTIDTVVKYHPHAVRRVRLERFSDSSACKIPPSLCQCSKLEELSVWNCSSQWNFVHDIIHSSSSTLKRLSFQYTNISTDGMKCLAPAISVCSQLNNLQVSNRHLSLDTVMVLTTLLPALSALKSVILHKCMDGSVGDTAMRVLCSALSKCVTLQRLDVRLCNLSGYSLPDIAANLHHWPALNWLDLSRNNFSDVSYDQSMQFIDAVNAHAGLRKIRLYSASLPLDHPLLSQKSYRTSVSVN